MSATVGRPVLPGTDPEPRALLEVARRATEAGGAVAMSWWRDERLRIEHKAATDDLVSQADRDAERAIREVIERERPADGILGEETGSTPGRSGVEWLVDPIDGTTSYLYHRHDWAVSVAALDREGRIVAGVVAEPALGRLTEASVGGGTWSGGERVTCASTRGLDRALVELNFGHRSDRRRAGACVSALAPQVRDVRRTGSAAAALAAVATGRADAYWGPGLRSWDAAAGILLVEEAGGRTGDLSATSPGGWSASGDVLAAERRLWEPLRSLLAPIWNGG